MIDGADGVLHDVVYAERIGFRPLSLDLHLPAGLPAPVIVFVHGGGWRLGSRRAVVPGLDANAAFGRMTAAGFAVAAIDYRLSGEAVFPAAVADVLAAVDWVRSQASGLRLDAGRIVLWGESSGAHLAALAALTPGSAVDGVIDWYGPADLTVLGRQLFPDDPDRFDLDPTTREAGLLGGPVGEHADLARAASPVHQVRAGAAPFLILHGEADDLVPIAQSEALAEALRSTAVPVELIRVHGASHFWRGVADTDALFDRSLAFAREIVTR